MGCSCSTGDKQQQPLGILWERRGWRFGLNAGSRPGSAAGARLRWLQVQKGQSHSSSPIRGAWLGWTPATPLPVIPAAPSKSRRAPAWSGSTGVSLQLGQSHLCFPCVAGQVPGTCCQEQQHVSWGCAGAGATPVGFKSCPFG